MSAETQTVNFTVQIASTFRTCLQFVIYTISTIFQIVESIGVYGVDVKFGCDKIRMYICNELEINNFERICSTGVILVTVFVLCLYIYKIGSFIYKKIRGHRGNNRFHNGANNNNNNRPVNTGVNNNNNNNNRPANTGANNNNNTNNNNKKNK